VFEKWKKSRDDSKSDRILQLLYGFWSPMRRKDLIFKIIMETDYSNEELVELGDHIGYTAHMRERENIDLSKKG